MLQWRSDAELPKAAMLRQHYQLPSTSQAAGAAILMRGCRRFAEGAEIFAQHDQVSDIYSVVSGAVRFTRRLLSAWRSVWT
jgi:CRP-like cAMP-binding protein